MRTSYPGHDTIVSNSQPAFITSSDENRSVLIAHIEPVGIGILLTDLL
jgi:hypothetical protein